MYEQRRDTGQRGGMAVLVRKALKVLSVSGNEYAQHLRLGLPDGSNLELTNVYLPPQQSLTRRGKDPQEAREAVADMMTSAAAAEHVLVCGDFNARCGDKAPEVRGIQMRRESSDAVVNNRANWLIQTCELAEVHILNGNEH